jgi:hypothetical protein
MTMTTMMMPFDFFRWIDEPGLQILVSPPRLCLAHCRLHLVLQQLVEYSSSRYH